MSEDVLIVVRASDLTGDAFNSANRNLRDLRAQANATGGSVGQLGGNMLQLGGAAGSAAGAVGSGGGGLGGALGALGLIAGVSVLPALGALVPMIAGAALAGAAAVPIFNGLKDSWSAAGKSGAEYKKAVADMPKPQREFTGVLREARKEFRGFGDDIRKTAFPGFTSGLKSAMPVIGTFKSGVKGMATTISDLARDAGKVLGSGRFRKMLQENFEMGNEFVDRFARGMGKLGVSLLEFGSKSRPTFDALNIGIGDLLGKDLPGMFQGLERGIGGSSKILKGMFDGISEGLPAFGRFAGQLADTFGPAVGSAFRLMGRLGAAIMDGLRPSLEAVKPLFAGAASQMDAMGGPVSSLIRLLGAGLGAAVRVAVIPFRNLFDLVRIAAPFVKGLGSAIMGLIPGMNGLNGSMGWTERLSNFVNSNKLGLQNVFTHLSHAVLDFVGVLLSALPRGFSMFRQMGNMALSAFGVIIHGAAKAFGWLPGVGPKIKAAASGFDSFANMARAGMAKADDALHRFAAGAKDKLKVQQLKLDIKGWEAQLNTAKEQLKDPNLTATKRAKLTARIEELQERIARGKQELASVKDKSVRLTATNNAGAGLLATQKTLNSLRGVGRPLTGINRAGSGKASAQRTINSLKGVGRGLTALNRAGSGKGSAQRTINSLRGVGRGLYARNNAWSGVRSAQRAINSLRSRTVYLNVVSRKIGSFFGFASGGIASGGAPDGRVSRSHAAGGGPRGAMTWVGEQGPELVRLPFGSTVRSAGDSRRIAAAGAGGGGGPMHVHVNVGGHELAELIIDPLRRSIQTRGGNVQAVLGR